MTPPCLPDLTLWPHRPALVVFGGGKAHTVSQSTQYHSPQNLYSCEQLHVSVQAGGWAGGGGKLYSSSSQTGSYSCSAPPVGTGIVTSPAAGWDETLY